MRKGINLISGSPKSEKGRGKIFIASVTIFSIIVLISLGLIIYRLVLKSSFTALEDEEQQLNQRLLQSVEKRDKFIETRARLTEIKNVLSFRAPTTIRPQTVSQIIPQGSKSLSLSGDDIKMFVSLESDSLATLDNLFEKKLIETARDEKRGIGKIDIESFGLNPKSSLYTTSFNIGFN